MGLGHVSRCTGLAVALRLRDVQVSCRAVGAHDVILQDGIEWSPLARLEDIDELFGCVVLDSYVIDTSTVRVRFPSALLVAMHDFGGVPREADLVFAPCADPTSDPRLVTGPSSATCLRPKYWGSQGREIPDRVERVLVVAGAFGHGDWCRDLALAVSAALPDAEVTAVRGPYATTDLPPEIAVVDAPMDLFPYLLDTDAVVTAAGQTLLESLALERVCVTVALAENQHRQAAYFARRRAAAWADPPDAAEAARLLRDIASSPEQIADLVSSARGAIDSFGALRVSFAVERLMARGGARA